MSEQITILVGDEVFSVSQVIGMPSGDEHRELVARMVIDWARDYAGEDAAVPLHPVRAAQSPDEPQGTGEFQLMGTWLAEKVDGCTCAPEPTLGQHEPMCGWEPVVDLSTVPGFGALITTSQIVPPSGSEGEPKFECPAVFHHGPGHQSRTRCERTSSHSLEDEHYARNPMESEFEWRGAEGSEGW